jgi:hypothetical protein
MPSSNTLAALVKELPRRLQLRFEALGGYVRGVVGEEGAPSVLRGRPLSDDEVAFIQLLALVYSLDRFLRDGTRAARGAAKFFEGLGSDGFDVGKTRFTRNNEATNRGERLADGLRASITGTRFEQILLTSSSMRNLVRRLVKEMRREQPAVD